MHLGFIFVTCFVSVITTFICFFHIRLKWWGSKNRHERYGGRLGRRPRHKRKYYHGVDFDIFTKTEHLILARKRAIEAEKPLKKATHTEIPQTEVPQSEKPEIPTEEMGNINKEVSDKGGKEDKIEKAEETET